MQYRLVCDGTVYATMDTIRTSETLLYMEVYLTQGINSASKNKGPQ